MVRPQPLVTERLGGRNGHSQVRDSAGPPIGGSVQLVVSASVQHQRHLAAALEPQGAAIPRQRTTDRQDTQLGPEPQVIGQHRREP